VRVFCLFDPSHKPRPPHKNRARFTPGAVCFVMRCNPHKESIAFQWVSVL
jgi:hypothetical protein